VAQPLRAGRQYSDMGDGSANVVAHALRAEHDASEDGTGRGTPLVASFNAADGRTRGAGTNPAIITAQRHGVRRLIARECERLQGFPDDYTAIPYRGRPAADGPRYRALGNSMAVPVMRWIGERIESVRRNP